MRVRIVMAVSAIALTASAIVSFGQQTIKWLVRGEAIVTCPCKVPCPCRSNAHPSQPHCENLSYVRVVEGNYGSTRLDGLEYVWAADECQGGAHPARPTSLYFDRSATPRQMAAIENIMTGEHCRGGKPTQMRAKKVELSARAAGSIYQVRAPSFLELQVDLAPGPIPMEPLPALDSWSNTVTYARNITARIDDAKAGLHWDYSGLQANYRTFEMSSELVQKGLMLAMFRDDTGRFNPAHRSLIEDQHLQVPLNREEFQSMLAQVRNTAQPASGPVKPESSGAIAGTVNGPDGKPLSGARIRITAIPPGVPVAVTNAFGRYFLARVPPGEHELCALYWDGKTVEKGCAAVSVRGGTVLRREVTLSAVTGN